MPMEIHDDKIIMRAGKYNLPKPWVGLTDEEIAGLHDEIRTRLMNTYSTKDIYRVLEAKLKEKNT